MGNDSAAAKYFLAASTSLAADNFRIASKCPSQIQSYSLIQRLTCYKNYLPGECRTQQEGNTNKTEAQKEKGFECNGGMCELE